MRKLKVGIVGLRRGTTYAQLFNNHPRTEVVALCDINPEALEKTRMTLGLNSSQCFRNYDDLLKADLDVIVIATPIPFHAEQSIKALENGKHVLCEVTAADNIKDCKRLVQTVKRTGMKYMLAENMCYVHFIREWRKIIQEGKLGKIYYAEAEYLHEIRDLIKDPKTGKLFWRAKHPPLHYCSHSLGPLLMILDDYIVKATASGKEMNIMPDVGVGAIDMQVALFETKKGVTIKLLKSHVLPRKPAFHFYTIYGTKGCVENTGSRAGTFKGLLYIEGEDKAVREIDCAWSDPALPEEAKAGGHGTSEYLLIEDFIKSIDEDTKPPIDVVRGVNMTIPGLIAHEVALKENTWLDVPYFE